MQGSTRKKLRQQSQYVRRSVKRRMVRKTHLATALGISRPTLNKLLTTDTFSSQVICEKHLRLMNRAAEYVAQPSFKDFGGAA